MCSRNKSIGNLLDHYNIKHLLVKSELLEKLKQLMVKDGYLRDFQINLMFENGPVSGEVKLAELEDYVEKLKKEKEIEKKKASAE